MTKENLAEQRQHLLSSLRQSGVSDERVLQAIADIPRELFVDSSLRSLAYEDRALPIENGQSISQPLIVAIMTQALQLRGPERVLEIGTGSGYQTAILARLASRVYSIERIQQLACKAFRRVSKLGIENVSLYIGDGSVGLPDEAPFDAIIVTAAAPTIPMALFEQLGTWGKLVVPVGGPEHQELLVAYRAPWGMEQRSLGGCLFVPLIADEKQKQVDVQ
ncbi:MAG TPA: protein-L-isoaspartate(D-aspartate) O-methyltransferase [Ktedonobacteraceae bacterium]|jgi:protein-L-isoaspartate(D-aspartate) O-methyltransferase|nr:protein-L-isoaspartate(D-aspartate) O-methyltransferase [Ktedonobacteraceae bacterium]